MRRLSAAAPRGAAHRKPRPLRCARAQADRVQEFLDTGKVEEFEKLYAMDPDELAAEAAERKARAPPFVGPPIAMRRLPRAAAPAAARAQRKEAEKEAEKAAKKAAKGA